MLFQRQTQHSLIHKALCSFIHTFYQSYSAILHSFIHLVSGTVKGFNVWFIAELLQQQQETNSRTHHPKPQQTNKQEAAFNHTFIQSSTICDHSFIHSFSERTIKRFKVLDYMMNLATTTTNEQFNAPSEGSDLLAFL